MNIINGISSGAEWLRKMGTKAASSASLGLRKAGQRATQDLGANFWISNLAVGTIATGLAGLSRLDISVETSLLHAGAFPYFALGSVILATFLGSCLILKTQGLIEASRIDNPLLQEWVGAATGPLEYLNRLRTAASFDEFFVQIVYQNRLTRAAQLDEYAAREKDPHLKAVILRMAADCYKRELLPREAFDRHLRAAELGLNEAICEVATAYSTGEGVAPDEQMSAYWEARLPNHPSSD